MSSTDLPNPVALDPAFDFPKTNFRQPNTPTPPDSCKYGMDAPGAASHKATIDTLRLAAAALDVNFPSLSKEVLTIARVLDIFLPMGDMATNLVDQVTDAISTGGEFPADLKTALRNFDTLLSIIRM